MVPIVNDVLNDYTEGSKTCCAQNLCFGTLKVASPLLPGTTILHEAIKASQNPSKPFLLVYIAYVNKMKRETVLLHHLFLLPYPGVEICNYRGQKLYLKDIALKFEALECFEISSMDAFKVPVYSVMSGGSHYENADCLRLWLPDIQRSTRRIRRLIFRNKFLKDMKFILIGTVIWRTVF